MSWKLLLADRKIEPHTTDLREIVDRNLHDVQIKDLSADNRFGIAYEAALLAEELADKVEDFRKYVETWIKKQHPKLSR